MTTTQTTDPLLTIEEVSQRLAITVRQARELVSTRRIASVRVGRRVRLRAADLEAYIAEHTTPARVDGR